MWHKLAKQINVECEQLRRLIEIHSSLLANCASEAPKARNAKAWANGPGARLNEMVSAEGAEWISVVGDIVSTRLCRPYRAEVLMIDLIQATCPRCRVT